MTRPGTDAPADTDQAIATSSTATLDVPSADAPAAVAVEAAPGAGEQAELIIEGKPIDMGLLAEQIEAILISSARPVPPNKLGQALGLIAPDQPLLEGVDAMAPDNTSPDAAAKPAPRKRRPRKSTVDPIELIDRAVRDVNAQYAASGRPFRIERLAGAYRLMILGKHRKLIEAYHGTTASGRLSKAGVETLAIIAYKQPISRAKLEAIRGVACGEVLRSLMERRLVTITGRSEELGRPMLYGTTPQFLVAFGLGSLKDLPAPGEFGTLKRE
jgi:segregation and condensation protein B